MKLEKILTRNNRFQFGTWYNEYYGTRTHDYFTFMINQFPVFAIRKLDYPGRSSTRIVISIAFLGFTIYFIND